MNVQDRILELCKKQKISISKLAKAAGISETTAYDWFNENKRMPTINVLEDVCSVFVISLSQFFSDVEFSDPSPQEIELLETFRKIPDKKKSSALAFLKCLAE